MVLPPMATFSPDQKRAIEDGVQKILADNRHPCLGDFWDELLARRWGDDEEPRRRSSEGVQLTGLSVHREKGRARVHVDRFRYGVIVKSIGETEDDPRGVVIGVSLDDANLESPRVTSIRLKSIG